MNSIKLCFLVITIFFSLSVFADDARCKGDCEKFGEKLSRNSSYQSGYFPMAIGSGVIFPVGGPIILGRIYDKHKPEVTNEFDLSEDDYDRFKEGYLRIWERKRRIKTVCGGTLGTLIAVAGYISIAIIINQAFINPVQEPLEQNK